MGKLWFWYNIRRLSCYVNQLKLVYLHIRYALFNQTKTIRHAKKRYSYKRDSYLAVSVGKRQNVGSGN
ncbi:hypothetical protein KL86DYS2_10697 [uncultured Dysgonomonas sp.]|uniref:Uncharacterized protein n=1 Tax=uncultured Dysgonomonas sp. TaxID=206096 RepID=A0A212J482_9BACT|nr:hypothetical protein KL86DYS2_10697 [uncultured Dysgonomonas sp.]